MKTTTKKKASKAAAATVLVLRTSDKDGRGRGGTPGPTGSAHAGDPHRVVFHDGTLVGPTTDTWDTTDKTPLIPDSCGIRWEVARTRNTVFELNNVRVRGGWYQAVSRSGGGTTRVRGGSFAAWVNHLGLYDSHPNPSMRAFVDRLDLNALHRAAGGRATKYSSVGIYCHPCVELLVTDVQAWGVNRYVLYVNGTPAHTADQTLVNVVAADCALLKTGGPGAHVTSTNCAETGTPQNGGSTVDGAYTSIGDQWLGAGMIGISGPGARQFINPKIEPKTQWAAAGSSSDGSLVVVEADIKIPPKGSFYSQTSRSQMATTFLRCDYEGPWKNVTIEGGTVRVIDSPTLPPMPLTINGRRG